jgi:hypothetical protein
MLDKSHHRTNYVHWHKDLSNRLYIAERLPSLQSSLRPDRHVDYDILYDILDISSMDVTCWQYNCITFAELIHRA